MQTFYTEPAFKFQNQKVSLRTRTPLDGLGVADGGVLLHAGRGVDAVQGLDLIQRQSRFSFDESRMMRMCRVQQ